MSANFKKYFKVQPDKLSKNEKIFLFFGMIILLAFGYFMVSYKVKFNKEEKEFVKSSNYKVSNSKATSYIDRDRKTVFYYAVNGETYKYYVRYSSDKIFLGESYKLRYKPERPEIAIIDFESPIINKTDFTITIGKVVELNEYHKRVKVKYLVDSTSYQRWIFVNNMEKFELKDNCELVFNIEKPEIAYFSYFLK